MTPPPEPAPAPNDLSPCQRRAFALLDGRENVFLTGSAGSGKSFLVRYFLSRQERKTFPVLASTGAAAVLIGGRTFHSFFGLGIFRGGAEATIERAARDRRVRKRLREIRGFVLDEVSMISGPTLAAAEAIARRARDNAQPWGGLRVVAVGDFAQLPPVTRADEDRAWAFLDPCWTASGFHPALLRTIVRTHDAALIGVLNKVRAGVVDTEVSRYLDAHVVDPVVDPPPEDATRLFPRRETTETYNRERLGQIEGRLRSFPTEIRGEEPFAQSLRRHLPVPEELQLKIGARVMLRTNDTRQRYVNGTVGTIEEIEARTLRVQLANRREVELEQATWVLLGPDGEERAWATNFPVTLAYAATIHKAQGATLERVCVDLRRLWEPGQAYVALSRVADGAGLAIEGWSPDSVRVDPQVTEFNRRLEQAADSAVAS